MHEIPVCFASTTVKSFDTEAARPLPYPCEWNIRKDHNTFTLYKRCPLTRHEVDAISKPAVRQRPRVGKPPDRPA